MNDVIRPSDDVNAPHEFREMCGVTIRCGQCGELKGHSVHTPTSKPMDDVLEFLRSFISGGVNQDFKPWAGKLYRKLYNTTHETSERQPAVAVLREALENISTVRPLEHFPAVTALAYCREKAIEALNATSAFQEVIVGEYEADGKINMASSPLPEGTKLYARLPLRHSEKAFESQLPASRVTIPMPAVKAPRVIEPPLACDSFERDPHSVFCNKCGYPSREHGKSAGE